MPVNDHLLPSAPKYCTHVGFVENCNTNNTINLNTIYLSPLVNIVELTILLMALESVGFLNRYICTYIFL